MARPEVLLLSFLLIATVSVNASADCVYTFFVQTGWVDDAGTDSVIRVKLYDKAGTYIEISNLQEWGRTIGPEHNYFENGNLDVLRGKASCLPSPVCSLTLTSDGGGAKPGWYLSYVDVTVVKADGKCEHQYFNVDQWLAVDEPPYELTVQRNNCPASLGESVGKVGPHIQQIV